eukprot:SAG22_NODE_3988_length_1435_cov_1.740269_2_plen_190_part_01
MVLAAHYLVLEPLAAFLVFDSQRYCRSEVYQEGDDSTERKEIETFLISADLHHHLEGLLKLGARSVPDLHDMKTSDLVGIGFRRDERRRFQDALRHSKDGSPKGILDSNSRGSRSSRSLRSVSFIGQGGRVDGETAKLKPDPSDGSADAEDLSDAETKQLNLLSSSSFQFLTQDLASADAHAATAKSASR